MTDLNALAAQYLDATNEFLQTVIELNDSDLNSANPGEWTVRQIIHHVADSEAQSYARLRRLIAEPGSQIQGYDEARWGENETLGYKVLPVQGSLDVFKAVRGSSLEIIKRLNYEQLDNSGIHSENGLYTVRTWLETYIRHPREHSTQIRSAI